MLLLNNLKVFIHHKFIFLHTKYLWCFAIVFTFFCLSKLKAQALIPSAESAFETQLPFNTEYIKEQKIKSITFDILDKKDMQVAEDKGLLNYYEFNSNGLLTRYYYTSISKIIQKEYHSGAVYKKRKKISNGYSYTKNEYIYDTISLNYFYNPNSSLKYKRYNDGAYYESNYYTYYADGKLESEKRCKETNVSLDKTEFKIGAQYVISQESYAYKMTNTSQYKKICLNDEDRIYKEVIYNLNDSLLLLSYSEQYTATFIKQEGTYTYNAKGQLTSAIYKTNTNGDIEVKRTYEYDANDCLLTEKQYKAGELLKEISYVTDATKKLTSYIIRDANNKSMRIVKLIYNY